MKKANSRVHFEQVLQTLQTATASVLQVPEASLSTQISIIDQGMSSLLAVEFIEILNQRLGTQLGVEVIFDYPDLEHLAAHVASQLPEISRTKAVSHENKRKGKRSRQDKGSQVTIEVRVKEIIAELLQVSADTLDVEKNFVDLGMSSLLAVDMVEAINQHLGLHLEVEVIFEYQSIATIVDHIRPLIESDVPGTPQDIISTPDIDSASPDPASEQRSGDIAIIGISGQFAGSTTLEEFWEHLQAGDNCIREINREDWQEQRYYDPHPDKKNASISKWGGLLDAIDKFDAAFFHISPAEAERMDPQQRLFLQEAFKAIEDGGYSQEQLSGQKIGVFVGGRNSEYKSKRLDDDPTAQTFLGNEMSILASRLSYFFNWHGPSYTIDTACSSSLVAIHLACESIRRHESSMALAGGVFLMPTPEFLVLSSKAGMLSPDGTCNTFDNSANGMVLGEGVGTLLLKRLEEAIHDGDVIHGVIKGSAINQSGKTNGITAPSVSSQKELLIEAYTNAAISPASISYVEAHGTGTKLGDSIEVKALNETFHLYTDQSAFCILGSHKPNFGHATLVAGCAGVFKVLLAMRHKQIPPTISIKKVNEYINMDGSPFIFNRETLAWQRHDGQPLRAGVSSFGSNGTNCHLIIEEAPQQDDRYSSSPLPAYLFPFSAQTPAALRQKISMMAHWLEKTTTPPSPQNVAYTLLVGRSHFPHRSAFIASNLAELQQAIATFLQTGSTQAYFDSADQAMMPTINADLPLSGEQLINELANGIQLPAHTYQEKLTALASYYLKGYNLPWKNLYQYVNCTRISLPSYPFSGERYWIKENTKAHTEQEYIEPIKTSLLPSVILELQSQKGQPPTQDLTPEGGLQVRGMNKILAKFLWASLYTGTIFTESAQTEAELQARASLSFPYNHWFAESLRFLCREQYLTYDGQKYAINTHARFNETLLWQEWNDQKKYWQANPATAAQTNLVEAMLRALPAILAGKQRATDSMFPSSSMQLVEGIYKNNPVADYFNTTLAETLLTYVQLRLRQDPNAHIRILEIGAGTGGNSEVIFQRLKPYHTAIQEYCYTDISQSFLLYAKKMYGPANPYLNYRLFDVETPITRQGFTPQTYDIVVAVNVLHATRQIDQTLRNVKALLKPNGLLLLNEINQNSLFLHLTFGLLEGWWRFTDGEVRIQGCPALTPQNWQTALQAEGFRATFFPAQAAHESGQQIIVAESDGVLLAQELANIDHKTSQQHEKKSQLVNTAQSSFTQSQILASTLTDQKIEEYVRGIIVDHLASTLEIAITTIDTDIPLREMQVDSILGVTLVQNINQSLALTLETTILFDYRSVNELTAYIMSHHKDRVISTFTASQSQPPLTTSATPATPLDTHSTPIRFVPEPAFTPTDDTTSTSALNREPIAIIGMSGRFGGCDTVDDLWDKLAQGANLVEKVTRWDLSRYYSDQTDYCNSGSFINGIDQFDPLFFNISGLEATYMDPQQRLFLEEAWKALEDAGYAASAQGRLCGVYVGCEKGDYQHLLPQDAPAQAFWGNLGSLIPARIAYYLDLQGPAIAVDSACSSSLVAIHLACQSLWTRETEMALAGGVFIHSTSAFYLAANRADMLSSTGHCYTFDERADGMVPGEAVGVVILKRLSAALADGDHIYATIRGSGINQDGASNGITAPSLKSQERLERYVYDTFQIDPAEIQMVEAHGTGTRLGDPIEYQAISRAFRAYTSKQAYCAIGSIKTNLGHTQIAAGITGLIKLLLSLKHRQMPPSLHFQSGNRAIQFEDSPFYVNTHLRDWETRSGTPRRAALSSFGASGTNAHMVIEEAPASERYHREKPGYLIVLSARSSEQLQQQAAQLIAFCRREPESDCGNISYTLLLGRKHFKHRLACVVSTVSELITLLTDWLEKGKTSQQLLVSEVREGERREQLSLKRYGNECIQRCREDILANSYLEQLAVVADLYVQAYTLDFDQLFTSDQYPDHYTRMALPTYPFARESYWVPEKTDISSTAYISPPPVYAEHPEYPANKMEDRNIIGEHTIGMPSFPPLQGTLTLAPVWTPASFQPGPRWPTPTEHVVLLGDHEQLHTTLERYYTHVQHLKLASDASQASIAHALTSFGAIDHIFWLAPTSQPQPLTEEAIITDQKQGVLQIFRLIKALLEAGYSSKTLSWTIITRQSQAISNHEALNPIHASIHGLIGALAKEYAHWQIRLLDLPAEGEWPVNEIFSLPADPQGNTWVWRNQEWYRQLLLPEQHVQPTQSPYRTGGVYVVIGGAGGIGEVWSEHMLRTYQAQIIWIGRRPLNQHIQNKIDRLAASGPTPLYISADASNLQSLQQAYSRIKQRYPHIHGIIHSAIVLLDQSLARMSEERFLATLSAKVDISVRMAQVFQQERLDFVLFFSSINSFMRQAGQSNYAAGSTFEDAFAHQLAKDWSCNVRVINWGYWGEVGVVASQAYQERMAATGLDSIDTPEAIASLDNLLTGPLRQLALVKTTRPAALENVSQTEFLIHYGVNPVSLLDYLQHTVREDYTVPLAFMTTHQPEIDDLTSYVSILLQEIASQVLQVPVEEVDADLDLHEYGWDQFKLNTWLDLLNQKYELSLTPDLLLEYATLRKIAAYLIQTDAARWNKEVPTTSTNPLKHTMSTASSMDILLYKLLWAQLLALGWFTQQPTVLTDLQAHVILSYLRDRWLPESLRLLATQHYLDFDGSLCRPINTHPGEIRQLWQEWERQKSFWLQDATLHARAVLAEMMLTTLPALLTGKQTATEIMFPHGSLELVEAIYQGNPLADYYNETLAKIVEAYIKERLKHDPTARLRILEIGAGTGATTTRVLKKLQPYQFALQEYCYSDLSKAFLLHAEQAYGAHYPYMNYQIFNVEQPVAAQGIAAGTYDLVIATNVLHATRDIRQTLRNAKAALRSGGLLLINEITEHTIWSHLTFGLLEGWWRFDDPRLRIQGSACLSLQTWQMLLESEGFRSIDVPTAEIQIQEQHIIIAESNGVARQQHPTPVASIALHQETLKQPETRQSPTPHLKPGATTQEMLREKSTAYIKQLIANTLKFPTAKIHPDAPLEEYGIDSLLIIQLTTRLSQLFPQISSTVFFEYRTISALVEHLLQAHTATLMTLVGLSELSELSEPPIAEEKPTTQTSTQTIPASVAPTDKYPERSLAREATPVAESQHAPHVQDIAIIGLSGRYPGARNMQEFWQLLRNGSSSITEIPADRWDWQQYFAEARGKKGTSYTKWGGFLKDVDAFDPLFFHISPKEAEQMDPQERLFLEEAYASIEDAGYTPANLSAKGRVGVFVGVTNANYPSGASYWSIANRVSYLLDFHGPSLAVDTACSSSLTAIHLALESLYSGTSTCAIAGGVNLIVDPAHYIKLSELTMLSSGEQCRAFGDQADGFVDGEGVGAIVLKPLPQAIADGDHIYGVLKGSMLNAGGKTNGYTVPNPHAQGDLVRAALERAGINARTISYIEAHGTGTTLGDPIEITGLTRAFTPDTTDTQFCALGSVKSNIGHTESAAGIAGLSKVLLQLKYAQYAPSLHSQVLNPYINFNTTPFTVQQELAEWKRPLIKSDGQIREYPRRAGISSFGAGGANAHILVEEYIPAQQTLPSFSITSLNPAIIVLSAKSAQQLQEQAQRLLASIQEQAVTASDLAAIAYTLQVGREAMEERLALLVHSLADLQEKLQAFVSGKEDIADLYRGQVKQNQETITLFADDELQIAVKRWIEARKYTKIADLWARGLTFDWNYFYDQHKPGRISLPTYPFARERYWMSRDEMPAAGSSIAAVSHVSESSNQTQLPTNTELLVFEETWQEATAGLSATPGLWTPRTLVCFLSQPQSQQEITTALRVFAPNCTIIFLSQGLSFAQSSPNHYTLDHTLPSSYQEALQTLQNLYGHIDTIFYLFPLEDPSCRRDPASLLSLIQALPVTPTHTTTRLLWASSFSSDLEQATLEAWIGLERSLGLILPQLQLSGLLARTSEQEHSLPIARWAQWLWQALQMPKAESLLYTDTATPKYLRTQPVLLQPTTASLLRQGGTYLITGGLGGLGVLFATYLARMYSARILLLGRSSLDESRQAALASIQAAGGEVLYLQADVCNAIQLREALLQGKERFGPLHGVIHAAGLSGHETILQKSHASFRHTLAAKIQGTLLLDELLAQEPLDFTCYFSSSAAILGDFGAGDYAVGNRFLISYGSLREQWRQQGKRSGKTLVINWPLWREGGMRMDDAEQTQMYLASSGQRYLETAEGLRIFEQLLTQAGTQYLILAGQTDRITHFLGLTDDKPAPTHEGIHHTHHNGTGRQAYMKGWTVEQCLEWDLSTLIGQVLKLGRERLDQTANLTDFGFDSISLAEFARVLSQHYTLNITPALFFGYPTLRRLLHYFLSEHAAAIHTFYEEESTPVASITTPAAPAPAATLHPSHKIYEQSSESTLSEPIAIIGMSGRFPQARNIDEFWNTLSEGQDVISAPPVERFSQQKQNWRGGWIPGVREFDPAFFEISPREAEFMDPRQRLLLQESWNALEDAGYGSQQITNSKIAMFVGVESGDYQLLTGTQTPITSNHDGILAARLAYFLNLHGPVMSINTACSSGLVAAHQACLSLRNQECDTAIAAGVSLLLASETMEAMDHAGMLSEDGRCYAFDRRANGLVPGEAVAVVVLKRLSQAIADGDPIYALIKGSGINYDGKTNGITAPGLIAQTDLLQTIYDRYQINPEQISYIITHGTGTRLGDPIEIQALSDAFKKYTHREGYCALTSTKTNVGHTFAASGLVSLIALVQALRHNTIPASLHCEEENDFINWKQSPFYINKTARPWTPPLSQPALGAVSAFGVSGTNAHMVVERYDVERYDYASVTRHTNPHPVSLLLFSARTSEELIAKITAMLTFLQAHNAQDFDLTALSYTLMIGRQHFAQRCAMVVQDYEDALQALQRAAQMEAWPGILRGNVARDFSSQKALETFAQDLLVQCRSLHTNKQKYQENLHALADLYCQGYTLPWQELFTPETPERLHLPTYPFARNQYWIQVRENRTANNKPKDTSILESPIDLQGTSTFTLPSLIPASQIHNGEKSAVQPQTKPREIVLSTLTTDPIIPMPEATTRLEQGKTVLPPLGLTPQVQNEHPSQNTAQLSMEAPAMDMIETLQEDLALSLADILYMERNEIDLDRKFVELGLDSIIGVEWIKTINKQYTMSLTASRVYDYPTIREFSDFLARQISKQGKQPAAAAPPSRSAPPPEPAPLESEIKPSSRMIQSSNTSSAAWTSPSEKPQVQLLTGTEQSREAIAQPQEEILPARLGNPLFQTRYHCKWSYYAGSMGDGVASVELVTALGNHDLLGIFGSAGLRSEQVADHLQRIRARLAPDKIYGMCLLSNFHHPEEEQRLVDLFLKWQVPVIEAAAFSAVTEPLVYFRVKGLSQQAGRIIIPRRIIAKCSHLNVARLFLSPPPLEHVQRLLQAGLINAEEAQLSQQIPLADDLAVETDSGGHTDQGVAFALLPDVIALKAELQQHYGYQEEIMVGCGGGIGTPAAIVSAFALGADFVFTGSINQCTLESGAHPVIKDILSTVSLHDTTISIAGDMFEIGARAQVVRKNSRHALRANTLYQLYTHYKSLDDLSASIKRDLETNYFKRSLAEVWQLVCDYKRQRNPEQIEEANENAHLKMAMIFKWYFAHCSQITRDGDLSEADNFQIFCGPAMGAFNRWVAGTRYEQWQNRHVHEVAALLMNAAYEYAQSRPTALRVGKESQRPDAPPQSSNLAPTLTTSPQHTEAAIAIIGMSGKFPASKDLTEFWHNLAQGMDCISEIPAERWPIADYYDPDHEAPGKTFGRWMGALDDIDKFDPFFFRITPHEAELMDPQQRLFLEHCWSAIENAGIKPSGLSGTRCGVFAGCATGDYGKRVSQQELNGLAMMGETTSILAARISYLLNLKGPSMAIDTACSSSLVAIAEACNSLLLHNSDLALAGGVNVMAGPLPHILISKAGMMSKDGHCYTFDNRANGFVPGEGVGVILLKRLSDAIHDQDIIHGVIRGWGVNQDGKTNGITAPSSNSQRDLLQHEVYSRFGINPETITLLEAHGTGTKLGDPIEVEALVEAFQSFTDKKQYCALGSVKSNIGHLLAAAGIAGVMKVLLALQNSMLPPTINMKKLNEHISLTESPFYANTTLRPWQATPDSPRRAGVSSFGFSGTNAHLVIEEYLPTSVPTMSSQPHTKGNPLVFVLSARSEAQLQTYAKSMQAYIQQQKELDLQALIYTLQCGRDAMEYRLAFLAESREELLQRLQSFIMEKPDAGVRTGQTKKSQKTQLFEKDDDARSLLYTWFQRGKFKNILELWVEGVEIDWQSLYNEPKPRRLSLPTYPFARQRYWLESKAQLDTHTSTPPTPIQTRSVSSQPVLTSPVASVATSGKQHGISLPPLSDIMPGTQGPSHQPGPHITLAPLFSPTAQATNHQAAQQTQNGAHDRSISAHQPTPAVQHIQDELIEIVAECLYLDPKDVDLDSTFVDMGMDAIIASELVHAINKGYGASLPATILYEHPGIRELAEFLQQEQEPRAQSSAQMGPQNLIINPPASLAAHPLPSRMALLDELGLSLAEALFKEEGNIDVDASFVDMGMDSIVAVEWVRSINKKYGTSLLATAIYDFSSLRKLAESLYQEFTQRGYAYPHQSQAAIAKTTSPMEPQRPITPIVSPEHQPAIKPVIETPATLAPLQREPQQTQPKQSIKEATTGSNEAEAIAIVGISGRYPGASDLNHYWDNLAQGKNCVREIPRERWDSNRYYDPRPFQEGKINCKWLGALDDIEYFDPLFFNISPGEAEVIDPQQRLFLEEAYKAFEDAGYSPQSLNNLKCNVYLGIMGNEYGQMVSQRHSGVASTTGNSFAIAAARIPYFLNLKGAAIAIDTACSSSLVATHLACQALAHHETDMALIGGVTLYLAPESYLDMCAAGMLSPDGQCKTFDTNANGFVPGEGVGAVVLKRLRDAEADHDPIYGVIIGSGINQDGKTNGITAPNMSGQMELLREVYQQYHIDPETISYVETHGTGTKLGDPIELEALSRVFKEYTTKKQFCAIGSVKSNIGHTSAAAGVASLHKVLLCLQHQQLVPSIHFQTPNEHFDFANSPLYVNTETRPWTSSGDVPRRACISSFGYSGTNAHLIIEEYRSRTSSPQRIRQDHDLQHAILFTLSAQSEPQLLTYTRSLHNWIATHPDFSLKDLAYTLQVGRRAMDYRLAFVAHSREELLQTLADLLTKQPAYGIRMAQVKKGKHGRGLLEGDEQAQVRLRSWLNNKDLHHIADAWVTGLDVDWSQLYDDHQPYRLNLPTYPFARERYWLVEQNIGAASNHSAPIASSMAIHPLVQNNISNPTGQHFYSTFTGNEFFLADHVVKGVRTLPGVAYLEMARVAFVEAAGPLYKTQARLQLKNVVWPSALMVEDHPREVHIRLTLNHYPDVSYEIYSSKPENEQEQQILSQGLIVPNTERLTPSMLNIDTLKTQCKQDHLSSTECYSAFSSLGIEYGPGFQSIQDLFIGQGCALAKLSLPASVIGTQNDYLLHPSLLDAAFQASLGLHIGGHGHALSLPFALEDLEIQRPCTSTMWAWVRYRAENNATNLSATQHTLEPRIDIDLCDEVGALCLSLKGFLTRTLRDQKFLTSSQASEGVLMLQPHWQEQPVTGSTQTPDYTTRRVIFLEEDTVPSTSN
ncbi:hypothetical protein KDI_07100 [Dictyobacter arantiisoli]|uniref:Polyketide synthase n=1 Tax=Dictyobacter arantiisoli TaxID=2014874 RepID=A0A5A5T7G5_9CHLR|nr:PfaD family polyunsaturated fatty acid/polyketide biosynthesis protein [Dictyobacter arantiisoli]GCF07146.1 hypothetical protein KDI_07100 [Dictyobacter arantiisoli]